MWYLLVSIPDLCRLSYFAKIEYLAKIWQVKLIKSPVASAAVHSKAVVLVLFIYCSLLLPLFVGGLF